jgi:AraC-like DNA-binding protein
VNATACESFGLRVGARMQPTAVGLTGLVSMHAPTVRDALQVLSSTLKTSNTGVATALDVRGVIFDAAALDWPVRDRDPDYAKILAPLLVEAVANAEGDFVSAVKSVLRTRIGAGSLTRDSVCRALGLNARTLAHRLEAFGVTFSGLADEVRFDAAQSLLLKDRRVGEIAAELGFAEPSAFIRAFKSWSGTTPARWRPRATAVLSEWAPMPDLPCSGRKPRQPMGLYRGGLVAVTSQVAAPSGTVCPRAWAAKAPGSSGFVSSRGRALGPAAACFEITPASGALKPARTGAEPSPDRCRSCRSGAGP